MRLPCYSIAYISSRGPRGNGVIDDFKYNSVAQDLVPTKASSTARKHRKEKEIGNRLRPCTRGGVVYVPTYVLVTCMVNWNPSLVPRGQIQSRRPFSYAYDPSYERSSCDSNLCANILRLRLAYLRIA
jgi:hypothetical protein